MGTKPRENVLQIERFFDACKQVADAKSFGMFTEQDDKLYFKFDRNFEAMSERDEMESRYLDNYPDKGWVVLDMFTANMFVQVYDALSESNQGKMDKLSVARQVEVMWKLVAKVG